MTIKCILRVNKLNVLLKQNTIQLVCKREGLCFKGTSNPPELTVSSDYNIVCKSMLVAN